MRLVRCWYSSVVAVAMMLVLIPAQGQEKKDTITITAEALGQEYDKNAKATHKKYEGKTVEVTGTVRYAMQTVSMPFLSLEGSQKALYSIYCETKDKQPWAHFAPGQKVKVIGTYTAGVAGPQLKSCEVTALDPNPAIVLTAESLAREFATAKDAANKKYQKKTVIISGTISGAEFLKDSGFTDITLKGAGKTDVIVRLHNSQQELGKSLKPGQMITLSGPFSYLDGTNVRIDMSFPVTKDAPK